MTAKDATELYKLFDQHGIKVWIDGGWAVDALLSHQTRKHDDLDIALDHSNLPALCKLLEACGYHHVPSGGSWGCNFVLADDHGHRIDVHSFEIDTSGENTFGVAYRAEHLTGAGEVTNLGTATEPDYSMVISGERPDKTGFWRRNRFPAIIVEYQDGVFVAK